jgi:hypothetical protein
MPTSPAERSLLASAAASTRWAFTNDRNAATASARKALSDRFEKLVDPEEILSPEERARRAAMLRRAHMQRLALKSARTRRAAADARTRAHATHESANALDQTATDLERAADSTDAELGDLQGVAQTANRRLSRT